MTLSNNKFHSNTYYIQSSLRPRAIFLRHTVYYLYATYISIYCRRFNAGSLVLKNRDIHPCFFQLKQSENNTVVAKNDEFINVLNKRLKTTTSREDLSPMRW